MKTAVLIPAYNEAETIGRVLARIAKLPEASEILTVVMDDGSTDDTASIARQFTPHVVSSGANMGRGEMIRVGFRHILENFPDVMNIVTIDADGQHNPDLIPQFVRLLGNGPEGSGADLVIGARFMPESPLVGVPPGRDIINVIAALTLSAYGHRSLYDVRTGYMGLRRHLACAIHDDLVVPRYGASMNIIICALEYAERYPMKLVQIPIPARYIGISQKQEVKLASQLRACAEHDRFLEVAAVIHRLLVFLRSSAGSPRRLRTGFHRMLQALNELNARESE